jgi:predicted RNase H-like HicB family nuclease
MPRWRTRTGEIVAAGLQPAKKMKGDFLMKHIKIVVEKHPDGYIAYPLGMKGVVVGQGDTSEEALSDVKSAIKFHAESFGNEVFETEPLDSMGH